MNLTRYLQSEYLPLPLIVAMILTRSHHFGDVLHLPDASLAVFFFAGFYRNKHFPGFLLVLAALIDYVALANGISNWCVSPAYVFLIPTYSIMWFAGRYASTLQGATATFFVRMMSLLALAGTVAFIISSGSYYLSSGQYTDITWRQYFARVMQYFPPYLSSSLIYGLIGFSLVKLLKTLAKTEDGSETAR